jgi:phosphoribosylformimino-5-aminoimidazole carboxamide ribotide isomerase
MPLEILPSVDLRAGKVVRLKQGDYGRQINYDVDPLDVARSYRDAGATWIHIVDLDGAKAGQPSQVELIARMIAASGLRAQVGGGIRSAGDIQRALDAGAARVVVGTKALEDWPWFESSVQDARFRERLVLALDARDGVVATRAWTADSGKLAVDLAREVTDWPLAAILYTDVAKDGMLTGPNFDATAALARAGRVPIIASGGVGNISHIQRLTTLPVWGVIIGRSLYEGSVDLKEALRIAGSPTLERG